MSREAELYKDKIEVSLDGRQIFYLFFGGAVIVGLVFVLGVMVGRRVEARGHTDHPRVAATVDPLAALDRLEGGSGLSFQGALRGDQGPVSDVEKAIVAKKSEEKKAEEKKAEAKKDEARVEKKEAPKPEAKKAEEPAKVEKKEEPKVEKAEAKKDEPKVEKKEEAKAEAKKDEPKQEAKKDEPAKKFTLQLSSFQDKAEAQAYLDAIKHAGYAPYIAEGTVDGKQYFRVRVGSYKSMEAANDAKVELEKATKKSAVVMKL
jgi:DedD protein